MLQTYESVIETPIAANQTLREFRFPLAAGTLERIDVTTDNPNAAGAAIFDVLKNGATIFPGGVGRPQIAASASTGNVSGLGIAVARNDKITITLATTPAGGVGGKLYLMVTFDDGETGGGGAVALLGDVTGDADANTVSKLKGRTLDLPAPSATYADDFADNTLSPKWAVINPASPMTTTETGARLEITAPDGTAATSNGLQSGGVIDFSGRSIAFRLQNSMGMDNAVGNASDTLAVKLDNNNLFQIYTNPSGGNIVLMDIVAGVQDYTAIAWTGGANRWFRIRHDAATDKIHWETSPDGAAWTSQRNKTPGFAINALTLQLKVNLNSGNASGAARTTAIDDVQSNIEAGTDLAHGSMLYWDSPANMIKILRGLLGFEVLGNPGDGQTLYYVASTNKFEWRTLSPAIVSGAVEEDISYSQITGNVQVQALNKLTSTGDWDAVTRNGARATQTLQAVGAYVQWKVGAPSQSTRYIGLRTSTPNHNNNDFDPYRIQFRLDGAAHVVENDALLVALGAYADGDVFKWIVEGTTAAPVLKLYQNGGLVATFATAPTFPLYVDFEMPFGGQDFREGKIKRTA